MDHKLLIAILIPVVTLIIGLVVGYYKSRANYQEKLNNFREAINKKLKDYVTVKDCENCSMKANIGKLCQDINEAKDDLKKGVDKFEKLAVSDATMIGEIRGLRESMELLIKHLIKPPPGAPPILPTPGQ